VELVSNVAGEGMSPKRHCPEISKKLEPVTKTLVDPTDDPDVGEMVKIEVGYLYLKSSPSVGWLQSWPFELTKTLTPVRHNASTEHWGEMQRMVVEFRNETTGSMTVPNLHTAVTGKSINDSPTTVTPVPPRSGP